VRIGLRAAPVRYDADLLDFLIRTGWLADADAGDNHKIGTAISAVMWDAARASVGGRAYAYPVLGDLTWPD